MPYLPLPILILLPLFFLPSHSKVPVQELYKEGGRGEERGKEGVLSWGWSSWIPHHSNQQTFTKHWGISSYQLDYWSPQRTALVRNKRWISSGPWQGLEPHCHFHLFLPPFFLLFFWQEWGSCFFICLLPLAVPFFSCPCLNSRSFPFCPFFFFFFLKRAFVSLHF